MPELKSISASWRSIQAAPSPLSGSATLGRRIREMGLVPGTEITVKQRAPLNDPVALRIMGGTLTLRNREADHITVNVAD